MTTYTTKNTINYCRMINKLVCEGEEKRLLIFCHSFLSFVFGCSRYLMALSFARDSLHLGVKLIAARPLSVIGCVFPSKASRDVIPGLKLWRYDCVRASEFAAMESTSNHRRLKRNRERLISTKATELL